MPKSVILNQDEPLYEWIKDEKLGQILDEVFETGYVVPFLESLQQFLSVKEVNSAVLSSFQSHTTDVENCYSDIWDGNFC